jgi:small subunit ribosomal protein S7
MSLITKKKYLILKYLKLALKNGKKTNIEKFFFLGLSIVKKHKKIHPLEILIDCIEKTKPFCEIKSIKIKGTLQRVPIQIKQIKQKSLILRWLIMNTFFRNEFSLAERFAKEFLDTVSLSSQTIKMRDQFHKAAEANKMFSQFK